MIASAIVSTNCTFVLNADKAQCSSDADCTSRGAAFAGTYCKLDTQVCVPSDQYCTTDKECVSRKGGQPYVCHKDDHTCHPLLSTLCTQLHAEPGDVGNDSTVWMGEMIFPSVHQGYAGADHSVELARREIVQYNSLPGVTGGPPHRPYAMVSCDVPPPRKASDIIDATNHLINDVRVAGIIGPIENDETAAVVQASVPAQITTFTPTASADGLNDLPGRNDLLYRLESPDSLVYQRALIIVNQYIEPKLKALNPPVVDSHGDITVAVVRDSSVYGIGGSQTIYNNIKFNGNRSAADNATDSPPHYYDFNLGDPTQSNFNQTSGEALASLLSKNPLPNIILTFGTAITQVPVQVESQWPSGKPKPVWIGSETIALASTSIINQAAKDPTLIDRFVLIASGPSSDDLFYNTWVTSDYNATWGSDKAAVPSPTLAAGAYDVTYMYYYALASLRDTPDTSVNVGKAIRNVADPNGLAVTVGPTDINKALSNLSQGKTLHFTGVRGTPKFNTAGDNIAGKVIFYCIDPNSTNATPLTPSGLTLSDDYSTVTGTSKCY